MIPKIIHYCWFGKKDLSPLASKCIDSWKAFLPDYEIMRWDETTFNVDSFLYTKQAYKEKKFAYVSDVVRLYALSRFGGIYMDTDVEVIRPFDELLKNKSFTGFEDNITITTATIGCSPKSKWIQDLLDSYIDKSFYDDDDNPVLIPNPNLFTDYLVSKGLVNNNTFQIVEDYISIYPSIFFSPKSHETGIINIAPDTHSIHHFSGSWLSKRRKILNRIKYFLVSITGESFFKKLKNIYKTV